MNNKLTTNKMQNWCNWTRTKTEGQMLTDLRNWQLQPCLPRCLFRGIICHAVGFLPFWQVHSWPFGNLRALQELCCFLPTTKCSTSRIPKLQNSVMRAAGILRVPIMLWRDIPHQAKGDHLDWVHSDQIVIETIRWGRLGRYSCSSL